MEVEEDGSVKVMVPLILCVCVSVFLLFCVHCYFI